MRKKELQKHLLKCGWYQTGVNNVLKSKHINWDLPLETWKETFVGAFLTDKPNLLHVLDHICTGLNLNIPNWDDISAQKLKALKNYLTSQKSANTTKTYLAYIKAVLNLNADKVDGTVSSQLKSATKLQREPSQHIALTEEEIEMIHRYQPKSKTEADVKRDFLIEAYTGARNSDAKNLTERNIDGEFITYVSQKTKVKTTVPLHRNLLQYLRQPKSGEHARKVIIDVMQRICKAVGIDEMTEMFVAGKTQFKPRYEFVGSHTARRSFASQLAVRGVPVAIIAKFMGHTSPDMTMRYICLETDSLSDDVRNFFS